MINKFSLAGVRELLHPPSSGHQAEAGGARPKPDRRSSFLGWMATGLAAIVAMITIALQCSQTPSTSTSEPFPASSGSDASNFSQPSTPPPPEQNATNPSMPQDYPLLEDLDSQVRQAFNTYADLRSQAV